MKNKLPGTTLIPVFQIGGIGITHDIDEALNLFKEFIHRCMSDDCEELTVDSITAYDDCFSLTAKTETVESYYSGNRYNISRNQRAELEATYDIRKDYLKDVNDELGSL